MYLNAKERLSDKDFLSMNYLQLFNRCFRTEETALNGPELAQLIKDRSPSIQESMINSALEKKIRVSAGIIPFAVCFNKTYVIAALSQRKDAQKRGVVLSAFGLVERRDTTIWEAALRETEEELSPSMKTLICKHQKNACVHVVNQLGDCEEKALDRLGQLATGKLEKLSLYFTIAIVIPMEESKLHSMLLRANRELSLFSDAYLKAVSLKYQRGGLFNEEDKSYFPAFFQSTLALLPESQLKETFNHLLMIYNDNPSDENQLKLANYLIEIGENKALIPLPLETVQAISRKASMSSGRVIEYEINGSIQSFYRPDFAGNLRLLFNQSLQALVWNVQSTLLKLRPSSTLYYQQQIALIIKSLLDIGPWYDPYGLKVSEMAALALGDVYHRESLREGSFIKRDDIYSHVKAARLDMKMAYSQLKAGTLMYQFTRPGGYIGDYYSLDSGQSPAELGISSHVSNREGFIEPRVKVTLVVVGKSLSATLSSASPVRDFWSQKNKVIDCPGGGKQAYIPLLPQDKQKHLVLLKPNKREEYERVASIAEKNNIEMLSREELQEKGVNICVFSANHSSFMLDTSDPLGGCLTDIRNGKYHQAIEQLQAMIPLPKWSSGLSHSMRELLFVLEGVVGKQTFTIKENGLFRQQLRSTHLTPWGRLHQARSMLDKRNALALIDAISPPVDEKKRFEAISHLTKALSLNRLASTYSADISYNDFDDFGEFQLDKQKDARESIQILTNLDKASLSEYELLIADIELAYAFHKCRENKNAIEQLTIAQIHLDQYISNNDAHFSKGVLNDLKLQALGIKLAIGMNLTKLGRTPDKIPIKWREIDGAEYLLSLSHELNKAPPVMVRLLFQRWVGPSFNDLFIEGWFHRQGPASSTMGTEIIEEYRKYFPLEFENLCEQLKDNLIRKLDLPHLGFKFPVGIDDVRFLKLCEAIRNNQSLTHLSIRRFITRNVPTKLDRARLLFSALEEAQAKGQKLEYLSYSGIYIQSEEAFKQIHGFLSRNQSLRVLQPSLFDYDFDRIQAFARILQQHKKLTTLLTGMLKCEGGGQMVYNYLHKHRSLRYVYPYPGRLREKGDEVIKENNDWLHLLKEKVSKKARSAQTISAHFRFNVLKSLMSNSALIGLTILLCRHEKVSHKISGLSLLAGIGLWANRQKMANDDDKTENYATPPI